MAVSVEPDQRARFLHGDRGRDVVQCAVNVGGSGRDLRRGRRVGVQVTLGEPDAPDVDRDLCQVADHAVVSTRLAQHEFGGPAADINHEVRRLGMLTGAWCGQFRRGAGERQPGLGEAGNDLGCNAEPVLDALAELRRVGCIPGGARGDHPHGARPRIPDKPSVVRQHPKGPLEGLRREPARGIDPLAEPDYFHPPLDVGQLVPGRVHIRDQQAQ
jgi:hypothetical protein